MTFTVSLKYYASFIKLAIRVTLTYTEFPAAVYKVLDGLAMHLTDFFLIYPFFNLILFKSSKITRI